MRDLRKVAVSAVFSVPHNKEIEPMLTIGMLAHPSIGDFREEPGCVAFISHYRARPGASEPDTAAVVLKRARRHACIPVTLRESAIIGMCAAGPLAFQFTHEHCRFATDHSPAAGIPS